MTDASDNTPPSSSACVRASGLRPDLRVGAWVLAALTFLAYWPSLRGGFVWDDLVLVLKNPLVTGEHNLINIWFAGDFSLSTVAMWFEHLLFGKNPLGYRVVNLALHIAGSLIFWRTLVRLDFRSSWVAALIFALHPVAVASVAWISELKNTLSLLLFLTSVYLFIRSENPPHTTASGKRFSRDYLLSVLSFALALMAKTSTVALPVLLLLLAAWQRGRIASRDVLRTSPHFALALVFGLMTIWFQTHQAIRAVVPQQENLFERILAAGTAVWFYAGKILLPINLSMIYPRWETNAITPATVLPLLALVVVILSLWFLRAKWPMARAGLFVLAAFVFVLAPVLGLFDMYFMVFSRVSDHLAYLALLILPLLIAGGIFALNNARLRIGAALLVLLPLGFLTYQRSAVFQSDESLWRDTIAKNPNAWNAHNNLACNLAERGDMDSAMRHFARSLELNPKNASAQRNYARALAMRGRFNEADAHFRAALDLKPGDADTLAEHGDALAQDGRLTEAAERYRAALDVKPTPALRLRLAPLLATTGSTEAAIGQFRLVLHEQPESVEALNNLAWILATTADAKLRDGAEAVRLAEQAWKLTQGKEATAFGTLAAAYAETGQFTNAMIAVQQAIRLAQSSGNVRYAQLNQQLAQFYRAGRPYHERVK